MLSVKRVFGVYKEAFSVYLKEAGKTGLLKDVLKFLIFAFLVLLFLLICVGSAILYRLT